MLIGHSYGGMGIKLVRFGQRVVFVSEAGRSVDGDSASRGNYTLTESASNVCCEPDPDCRVDRFSPQFTGGANGACRPLTGLP